MRERERERERECERVGQSSEQRGERERESESARGENQRFRTIPFKSLTVEENEILFLQLPLPMADQKKVGWLQFAFLSACVRVRVCV